MTELTWETSARARLARLTDETVSRIRDAADQIEREAARIIDMAAKDTRRLDFETYSRVAAQTIKTVQTLVFNIPMDNLIDAAQDAEAARTERLAALKPVSEEKR